MAKKSDKFGSAPIDPYNHVERLGELIFMNEDKRNEWENLAPEVKKSCLSNLNYFAKKMENTIAIEMLCNVIGDMDMRIKALEDRLNTRAPS